MSTRSLDRLVYVGHVRFGPKLVRLAPNGINPGSKMYGSKIGNVSICFVFFLFWANLTQFWPKPDTPSPLYNRQFPVICATLDRDTLSARLTY